MGEREVPVTSMEQLRDGARVRCKIEGVQIDDARLSLDQDGWYVCQNARRGCECADRKGYDFSWWFSLENSRFLTDLVIIEDDAIATTSAPEAVKPRKRRLYLANKMRGLPFFNFEWFDAMRDKFTSLGWDVVSPADLDRAHGFDAMKLPADYDWNTIPAECGTEEEIMKRDIAALQACDAIWLGPQWRDSKGARIESDAAHEVGMVVFSAPDWLGYLTTPDAIDDHDEHMKRLAAMKESSEVGDGQVQELAPAGSVGVRYTERGAVLDEAKNLITGDRNVSYGPPERDFAVSAGMMNALFGHMLKDGCAFKPRDVAWMMICVKASRAQHSAKRDNYVDVAGYAGCGWECECAEKKEVQ